MGQKKCVWWEAKEQRQIKSGADLLDPMSPCAHKCAHTHTHKSLPIPRQGCSNPGIQVWGAFLSLSGLCLPQKPQPCSCWPGWGRELPCVPPGTGGAARAVGQTGGHWSRGDRAVGVPALPLHLPASTTSMNARFRQSVNSKWGGKCTQDGETGDKSCTYFHQPKART